MASRTDSANPKMGGRVTRLPGNPPAGRGTWRTFQLRPLYMKIRPLYTYEPVSTLRDSTYRYTDGQFGAQTVAQPPEWPICSGNTVGKTEREGFEPSNPCGLHDFESCGFNRTHPPLLRLAVYIGTRPGKQELPSPDRNLSRSPVDARLPAHSEKVPHQYASFFGADAGANLKAMIQAPVGRIISQAT